MHGTVWKLLGEHVLMALPNTVEIIGPIVARGELIEPTANVGLTVVFRDGNSNPINTDAFPTITLVQPSGLTVFGPTSTGVFQVGVGQYEFIYQVPIDGPFGVWNDVWEATINGFLVENTFSFVVAHTDLPGINSDGKLALGDDVGFSYSQTAIYNINKVIKMMKARLNSSGKAKSTDAYGNVDYVDCDIFSVDMLATFAAMSLAKFNSTPYFTWFSWDDSWFFGTPGYLEVIAEGAVVMAMASQALIEKGREFQMTDNGVTFNPPNVAEMLQTQYAMTLTHYWEQLKYIKNSMRPAPIGAGVFGMFNGVSPAIKRLRFLRERRIL
jgi:hypothetical protein